MNYVTSCESLDIDQNEEITIEILKRQYRIKALAYHPDKNHSENAAEQFRKIRESYECLLQHLEYIDEYDNIEEECSQKMEQGGYLWNLFSFAKTVFQNETSNLLLNTIIKKITTTCENKALETLEKLDKEVLIKTHDMLKKYKEVFHFTSDFFEKMDVLVKDKVKFDECVILNPLLDDLFENNLYKLKIGTFTYVVPLWHHELIYDNSGCDIYVKCIPVLPEEITIDNKNNIHVELQYSIHEIWNKETIEVSLGNQIRTFRKESLKMKETQTLILEKQGISKINDDIYDVSKKGDVVLHIQIT